jgi:hypothetical protein
MGRPGSRIDAAARSTIERPSRRHPGPRIRIVGTAEIAAALDRAGLRSDRALIVLVGGAGGMGREAVRDRGPSSVTMLMNGGQIAYAPSKSRLPH